MNETEVCRLVSEVFCGKFDQSAFERFLANLLKTHREDYRKYDASTVPEAYRNTVKEYASLGSFTDTKKTSIALLIVQLTDDRQLDRARTRQRDFIADYLRNSGMHAALMAFLVPHRAAWRLSLVKLDHSWAVEGGKTKLREELTPAKRWSFAVSTESRNHTVKKRSANYCGNQYLFRLLMSSSRPFRSNSLRKSSTPSPPAGSNKGMDRSIVAVLSGLQPQ